MAMAAGLVAFTPHIDLERFHESFKPSLVLLEFLIERVHAVDLLAGCPMHGMLNMLHHSVKDISIKSL